jgi:hypothetical protein
MTEDRDLVKRLRSAVRLRPHNFTATPQECAAEVAEDTLRLEAAVRIEALERQRDSLIDAAHEHAAAAHRLAAAEKLAEAVSSVISGDLVRPVAGTDGVAYLAEALADYRATKGMAEAVKSDGMDLV